MRSSGATCAAGVSQGRRHYKRNRERRKGSTQPGLCTSRLGQSDMFLCHMDVWTHPQRCCQRLHRWRRCRRCLSRRRRMRHARRHEWFRHHRRHRKQTAMLTTSPRRLSSRHGEPDWRSAWHALEHEPCLLQLSDATCSVAQPGSPPICVRPTSFALSCEAQM